MKSSYQKPSRQNAVLSAFVGFFFASSSLSAALVVSVAENPPVGFTDPLLVTGGYGEDAVSFTDRTHQWNSSNLANQPTLGGLGLVGADYVRTSNDARSVGAGTGLYAITLAKAARVYVFLDNRTAVPAWAGSMGFTPAFGYQVGVDEAGDGPVDNNSRVYTTVLPAGTHTLNGMGFAGNNNYGIAAVNDASFTAGITQLGLTVSHTAPTLSRQSFAPDTLAFVDRVHTWQDNGGAIAALNLSGGDLIRTDNDARSLSGNLYSLSLFNTSFVNLLLDNRWLTANGGVLPPSISALGFVDTGYDLGLDVDDDGSINDFSSIYRAALPAGTYTFPGLAFAGTNNYGFIVTIPEPSRALFLVAGFSFALCFRHRRKS